MEYNITPIHPFGLLIEPKRWYFPLTELNIVHLRELAGREHLIILRGFSPFQDAETFAHYCERWGKISIWPFGKVLELVEQDNPDDHIFANSYVPLHWDGMYRLEIPEFQIFHCAKAPLAGQGGRTTFSNTKIALRNASVETKKMWNKVTGVYQRKMEFYNSKTVSPIIIKHPNKEYLVIRYNEPPIGPIVNPPILEFKGISHSELNIFHDSLKQALYSPSNFYAHVWQAGDIVIADNFSLLHGREAFISKTPRHLLRVHVLSNPPYANPGLESYQ